MRKRVQPGPEPWRARLDDLDAKTIGNGAENLVLYARGFDAPLTVPARTLVEAIQTAYDAARAREHIARGRAIPPRWLAALAGVNTSRIRQLVRDRVLEPELPASMRRAMQREASQEASASPRKPEVSTGSAS